MDDILDALDPFFKSTFDFLKTKEGIVSLTGILPIFWSLLKSLNKLLKFLKVKADLHPFYSLKEVRYAAKYYIETREQKIVSEGKKLDDRNLQTHKLIHFFINKSFQPNDDDQRFYLVLAEGGMGKTTFLINLYLRYTNKILSKKYKIDLMPLWHPKTWERVVAYSEEDARDTILLLDSLDEDPKAISDINQRLNEIIDKVWFFRKVIICCSPQLFPNEESEPSEIRIPHAGSSTGFHNFLKIYIAPFDKTDIIRYINKRFSILRLSRRRSAVELIRKSASLMERPLLLSFLDDLLSTQKKYDFAYEVYDALIERWINREAAILPSNVSRDVFKKQLTSLSKDFAYQVFLKYQRTKGFFLDQGELVELIKSKNHEINTSIFRTKSLITRTESGLFKFSHFSIFEFFLAQLAIDPTYEIKEDQLDGFLNAQIFYQELFWHKTVLPFFAASGGRVFTKMNNTEIDISKILANGGFEKVENLFISGLKSLSLLLISPLKNILTLQAIDTPILSYEGITNLKKLQTLNFENCKIEDVKPLKFLTDLSSLHLKSGSISDLSPLADLTALQYLNLENNYISDLAPLQKLKRLRRLSLVNNQISDIMPLCEMENLSFLFIANNPVAETQIENLKKLLPNCTINTTTTNTHI